MRAWLFRAGESILTPIWYLYRDGRIYMRTGKDSVKAQNIARDARVSVCVQDERPPYRSVTVYGRPSVEPKEEGLDATIARRYLGAIAGAGYMRLVQQNEEVRIVVTPERVLTQDFSAETPFAGRIWLLAKRLRPPWL